MGRIKPELVPGEHFDAQNPNSRSKTIDGQTMTGKYNATKTCFPRLFDVISWLFLGLSGNI